MALTIALIAHDGKKSVMVELARQHIAFLSNCRLMATGTTGSLLQSQLGLTVERMLSGTLGGDLQISARLSEGAVDAVIFCATP